MRFRSLKRDRPRTFIRFAVRAAVAVTRNRAIGVIDNGDMHEPFVGLAFFRSIESFRAVEKVTSGHPIAGFFFAEDNGIEELPIESLYADHTSNHVQIVIVNGKPQPNRETSLYADDELTILAPVGGG